MSLSSVTTVTVVEEVVDPMYTVAAEESGPTLGGFPLIGIAGLTEYSIPAPSR